MAAALPGPGFYDSCMGEQGLAEVAAQLYALPFDDFVAARTAAAKDAAAAKGRRSLAAEVRSLPKPSVAAWTVNMLAARRPETLRELTGLGQSMRAAQSSLDAPELRRLGQERRQLLGGAVKAAQAVAEQQGRKISSSDRGGGGSNAARGDSRCGGRGCRAVGPPAPGAVRRRRRRRGSFGCRCAARPRGPRSGNTGSRAQLSGEAVRTGTTARKEAEQPRLRAVRQEPRRTTPSALERARALLKDAEEAAASGRGGSPTGMRRSLPRRPP